MRYSVLGIKCSSEEVANVQKALAKIVVPSNMIAKTLTVSEEQMETMFPLLHSVINRETAGKLSHRFSSEVDKDAIEV